MNARCMQVAVLSFALLAGFSPGRAQEKSRAFGVRGVIELGGSLSYSATWAVVSGTVRDTALHQFTAMPYVAYFVIDGLEIGINPLGFTYSSQGSSHITQLTVLGSVAYNFKTPTRVYPFVEGLAGYALSSASAGTDRSGFTWGGRGGVKVPIAAGALLNVGVQYLQVTLEASNATARSGYNELGAVVGFSVWL